MDRSKLFSAPSVSLYIALLTVVGLPAAILPRVGAQQGPSDLDLMKGGWFVRSYEEGGVSLSPEMTRDWTFRFDRDTVSTKYVDGTATKGRVKLDPATSPKGIDFLWDEGDQVKIVRGIYEFKGKELRICVSRPSKPRPREFSSKYRSDQSIVVLARDSRRERKEGR